MTIFATLLVQRSSAATVVLANVLCLPLIALLFCCPLPLLEPQPFRWRFAASLVMVVVGNLIFNRQAILRATTT